MSALVIANNKNADGSFKYEFRRANNTTLITSDTPNGIRTKYFFEKMIMTI